MSKAGKPRRRFDWPAHLAEIEAMLADGATGADVGRRYGLTLTTALSGLKRHGLTIKPEATLAGRIASCRHMNSDTDILRRRSATQQRKWCDADRIERGRAHMAALHQRPGFTARAVEASRCPAAVEKRRQAAQRKWDRAMAWCPPQFRKEYDRLIYSKGLRSREAKAALARDIAAFALTFEGQLWKLSTGKARLVPNQKFAPRPTAATMAGREGESAC